LNTGEARDDPLGGGFGVPMSEQLSRSLGVLRRRWRVIALVPLVALVVSLIVSSGSPSRYSATAKVVLSPYNPVTALLNPGASPTSADPERDLNTEVSEITETPMADLVRQRLRLAESGAALLGEVDASLEGTTNIVDITVVDGDPAQAARIANAFASEYVTFRLDGLQATLAQSAAADQDKLLGLTVAERTAASGRQLEADISALQADIDGLTSDARVSEVATVPSSPFSPRPAFDALIAVIVGLLVAITIVVLMELFDRTVRDEAEALSISRLPSLGAVPKQRSRLVALATAAVLDRRVRDGQGSDDDWLGLTLANGNGSDTDSGASGQRLAGARASARRALPRPGSSRAGEQPADNELDESFGALAVSLLAQQRGPHENVVMVTSANPQDGKTSVAIGLAAALAELGQRVTLVECDLRRPRFAECLGLESSREGLSTILAGQTALPSGLIQVVAATRQTGSARPQSVSARRGRAGEPARSGHTFTMLPCGPIPDKPLALLRGAELAPLMGELQGSADVVLVDTPPLGAIKDAVVVAGCVDQIVLVARIGHTRRDMLARCLGDVEHLGVPVLGLVTVGGPRGGALDYYFRPEFHRPRGHDHEPRLIAVGEPPVPSEPQQRTVTKPRPVAAASGKPGRPRRRASTDSSA
jgi:Mrp family chromosome partitioning ATPase/capsular polysaccharide biosynthesis protein